MKRPLPPAVPPPAKAIQKMNPSEAIRSLGNLDKQKMWSPVTTALLNDLENEMEGSALRHLLFEPEMAQSVLFAMKNVTMADDAQNLLKLFIQLVSSTSPTIYPISEGSDAVNFLQAQGAHAVIVDLLRKMRRDQTTVQLCFQSLSTLYSLSSDETMRQTFAKEDSYEGLVNILTEARRIHTAVFTVREQFVVLMLNISARCPASLRKLLVDSAAPALISIGRAACEAGDKSGQTSLLAEDVCGALHNMCFDDSALAKSLRKQSAIDLATRVIQIYESEWTVVCCAVTLIADLSSSSVGPGANEASVPVSCLRLVRDCVKKHIRNEHIVQAGICALARLTMRDDMMKELVSLDEQAEDGLICYNILLNWKDSSEEITERCLLLLALELAAGQPRIRFRTRIPEALKQHVTKATTKSSPRPRLFYAGKRVLAILDDMGGVS